ncbi:hypothetical protein DFJ58DRAFT_731906 [Suillus subalutaceus]|uniref:uncharacterized protein n=1 Tax=Suillus subalutaceus TaxID=48586 RepID=UPI001B872D46|nr:uncharacterized protein DFJ58DRAFT_731906 [Suillus subalutaceus]KAG1842747.1 hypothetical protein DFJ58DRAFT_731906 [Suillus subalutaceus]
MSDSAVGPNGELKDASEMVWFNDVDDKQPIPSSSMNKSAPLHPFFTGAAAPAAIIAGYSILTMLHHPAPPKIVASPAASVDDGESDCDDDIDIGGTNLDHPDAIGGDTEAEDDTEHAYASTKDMGDADRKGSTHRPKTERTADVHTIFIKKDDYVDPHTRLVEHRDHIKIYQENCKKLDIPLNERACLKSDGTGTLDSQQSLDGIVVHQPRAPMFTTSGLLDYVVELIVCEDKAFQLVEKGPFRRLLTYLQPSLANKDIPHCKAVHEEIMKKAAATKAWLKDVLKDIPSKVSFTFDAWTSNPADPFLSVTGHYIHAHPDKPNDWKLRTDEPGAKLWDPVQGHVRCMEHTINLAAGRFVTAVSPTSACKLLKKIKATFKHAQLEGQDVDLDALEADLDEADIEGENQEDDDDNNNDEFGVGDTIRKALALVKQIHASLQARAFFAQSCKQADVPILELMQWEPASATQTSSSSHNPSVWRMILVLEFLQKSWENMANLPRFSKVSDAIQNALENVAKWYHNTEDTDVYFICLALDPNVKIAYAKHQWDKASFEIGLDKLR